MLQQNRPLTGQFSDYLTDVDESWECLPPDYQSHLDQNMPEWWEDLDKEMENKKKCGDEKTVMYLDNVTGVFKL